MTTIDVVSPESGKVIRQPLPMESGACSITLQALAGASHLQIRVRDEERLVLYAEVECAHGESVDVRLARQANGYALETGLRNVYFLPASVTPAESIYAPPATESVEVALLIDATAFDFSADDRQVRTLLQAGAPSPSWSALARKLAEFTEEIKAHYKAFRACVLAFGDHPTPIAQDGIPLYPASSAARQLRAQTPEQIYEQLTRLPRISGGDFIDALADAMDVCASRSLAWSDGTRKLLLILGNSPGYSILDAGSPLLELADAQTRVADVYQEAADLHRMGIEIVTVFHDSGVDEIAQISAAASGLLDHTRSQYQRLSTRPEWAFASSRFDPRGVARQWASTRSVTGRGSCPGVWVRSQGV